MVKKMNIVSIIPARGGSKGVPRKNIKLLGRKPLISYAIKAALASKYIDRVIVSTDNEEIAEIAKKNKAEVPFIRPSELAQDTSTTLSVLQHAIQFLINEEQYTPDLIVLIQPTSPFVTYQDINSAIEKLIKKRTNSCVSFCEVSERPEWMFVLDRTDKIYSFLKKKSTKTRRQDLPKVFRLNGAVYVAKRDLIMKEGKIIDETNCSAILMPQERSVDIDKPVDFWIAEAILKYLDEND